MWGVFCDKEEEDEEDKVEVVVDIIEACCTQHDFSDQKFNELSSFLFLKFIRKWKEEEEKLKKKAANATA